MSQIIIVSNPTLETYQTLYTKYNTQLRCSCKYLAINFYEITRGRFTLHQICSHDLVETKWLNRMLNIYRQGSFLSDDFPSLAPLMFQGIKSFCQLANKTIVERLDRFYQEQSVNAYLLSETVFHSEQKILANALKLSISRDFSSVINLIQGVTTANLIMSGLQTDHKVLTSRRISVLTVSPRNYSGSSCFINHDVVEPLGFKNRTTGVLYYVVPGMFKGCYPMDGLLYSTLECFYSEDCLYAVMSRSTLPFAHYPSTIDSSSTSRYLINSTLKDLLGQAMIENWEWIAMYDTFYNKCQPYQCTYTVIKRNQLIYIVTTITSFIGGLMTALKLIVPMIIKIFGYWKRNQLIRQGKFQYQSYRH